MPRSVAAGIYVVAVVIAVALLNAHGGSSAAFLLWVLASIFLGAATGRPSFALLALLAIPVAIPFGIPDDDLSRRADPVLPLVFIAAYFVPISALLIVASAFARRTIERLSQRHSRARSRSA
jgi:hypothetical protein